MKFPMYDKSIKDKAYMENPYRVENFKINDNGVLRRPNGKAFLFRYRNNIHGYNYGRQEKIYECEDCSGCPYTEECKTTSRNRTVSINDELTASHREVLDNLENIQAALLRMKHSIQAQSTFGTIKNDRHYKRIVRRGTHSVELEIMLVSISHNLYEYYNKQIKNC